jgi:hypothetical protein
MRWSLGWVSAVDSQGRTIWIVDAHRGDGKRFVVRADEKLSAFVALESAIHERDGGLAAEVAQPLNASKTSGYFADSLAVFCGSLNA